MTEVARVGDRVVVRADLADEAGHATNGLVVDGDVWFTEDGRDAVWVRPDDSPENESYAYDAEYGVDLVPEA